MHWGAGSSGESIHFVVVEVEAQSEEAEAQAKCIEWGVVYGTVTIPAAARA